MAQIAALILAAGRGTRMNSKVPKVLHPVCGRPVLGHVIQAAKEAGANRIVCVVGNKKDEVGCFARSLNVEMVEQRERRGTGHAVLQAAKLFSGWRGGIIVLPGDAPCISGETLQALIRTAKSNRAKAVILTAEASKPEGYGRILKERGQVSGIREELDASAEEREIREINSGAYFFEAPLLFHSLGAIKKNPKKKEYYLTDAIEILARRGEPVRTFCTENEEEVLGVNTRRELAEANRILNERELRRHMNAGVTISSPAQTFIAGNVRIGADTVIHPFTWIDRDVTIGAGCEVGPFAKIRSGVRIGKDSVVGSFVEIARSKIGKKTLIKHLSYLGDAEIGNRVNVGAGTITANFDGFKKHKTIIGDDSLLGSNTVLVAPTRLGRRVKTGAGAVVCAGQSIPAGKTVVGVPAKILRKKNNHGKKSQ